jgi:hypothetical protein
MTAGDRRRAGARVRAASAWARSHPGMVLLLATPVVVFGVSQLFGRVFVDGDNLLQNLPLRVLVGSDLRHGVLPLWNPYLSSGTPLLAGFNAGAAYPATWLMALLPTFTAWTIGQALVYDVAVAGMYLFLRRQTIGPTAATFGAATFAFAGFMTAQMVHIDLIEGAAWLPWMALAVHGLTDPVGHDDPPDRHPPDRHSSDWPPRSAGHRTRGWIALLAVSVGLSILTGGAESIIDSGVLVAVYGVGRLVTMGCFDREHRRALVSSVLSIAAGVAGSLALGAAQWLPGAAFSSHSQRSVATFSFFTSGSLPARLLTLLASPFVLGTNQAQPGYYAGPYNFEEVSSYMGILALIAACSLFLRKWRTRPEARHWWVWYVIMAVGLLSALGGQTPFGHLLFLVPEIRSERLLSRNLLLVDFSLAVLLGWWAHLLLGDHRKAGATVYRSIASRWRHGRRSELAVTCAPLALITAVCVFLWAGGPLLYRFLQIQFAVDSGARHRVAVLVTVGVLIAAAATWTVLSEARLTARQLRWLLAGILAVDLIVFNVFVIRSPITETATRPQAATAGTLRSLVGDGRFIIYDPDQFDTGQLYALGQTDLNVYDGLPSGQGYTALTDGDYYDATGAHYQEDLDPATLAGTTWDDLNATTLLSLPGYFVTPVDPTSPTDVPFPPHPAVYNSAPVPRVDSYRLATGESHRWYFGGVLTVDSVTVPVLDGSPADLRVGLVTTSGGVRWLPTTTTTDTGAGGHRSLEARLPRPTQAGGVIVESTGPGRPEVGVPIVDTAEAGTVALDGRMQFGVTSPHWVFTGTLGPFGVFHNSRARGWAQVRAPTGGAPPTGSTVTAEATGEDGRQQITVHTTGPAVLVRSETWSAGWRATVQSLGSDKPGPEPASVVATGVLQAVALPNPGDYLVTFTYSSTPAVVGLLVSGAATAALGVWACVDCLGAIRRRRRRMAAPSPEVSPD